MPSTGLEKDSTRGCILLNLRLAERRLCLQSQRECSDPSDADTYQRSYEPQNQGQHHVIGGEPRTAGNQEAEHSADCNDGTRLCVDHT